MVLAAATGALAGLTRDGLAAIHIYTQESALYSMLNKILRSRGEERKTALSPFMQYHKLLMTALGQVRTRALAVHAHARLGPQSAQPGGATATSMLAVGQPLPA